MNTKGQTLGLALISGIMVFILGLMIINFLFPEINTARGLLACNSPATISDGTKLLCLVIDATVPYWVLAIVSIAVGAITARLLL